MPYYGEPKVVNGNNWFYVSAPGIGSGYVLGKFLSLTDETGTSVTPSPTPASEAPATTAPMVVNTPAGKNSVYDDSYLRKNAIKARIPYITTIDAARAAAEGIRYVLKHGDSSIRSLQEWHSMIQL